MLDVLSVLIVILGLLLVYRRFSSSTRCALVVVQGDIGRSPRMQYHTLSLLKRGYKVNLMGYDESPLIPEITCFKNTFRVVGLKVPPARSSSRLAFILKALQQSLYLTIGLLKCDKPSVLLLQNPPSIPTMAICSFFRFVYGYILIYDWHNYGHTLLGLTLGSKGALLYRVSKAYEQFFAQFSDFNLCVSKAMQKDLNENWDLKSTVLYDKAPARFQELKANDRLEFLRSQPYLEESIHEFEKGINSAMLIVSATSWTEDEDFKMLLDALVQYDQLASAESRNVSKSHILRLFAL